MDDENSCVIANKTAPPLEKSEDTSKNEDECTTYGWRKTRPKSLKFLSSPVWFVIVFSVYNVFQGWYLGMDGVPNLSFQLRKL